VSNGAVNLWYHIAGRGSDTVLVPLGAYLAEPLAALSSSHTLVFYDPRHRGRSDAYADTTLSTFENDVSDVDAVRRELGLGRVAIVGFSYFAGVAVTYAARNPERVTRLVLVSPIEPTEALERAYDPPERITRIDTTRARALLKLRAAGRDTTDPAGYCIAYWQLNAPLFVGDVSHANRITPTWCQYPNESPRSLSLHLSHAISSLGAARDFSDVAKRVNIPVLIVQGTRDLVVNPAGATAWARLLPQARVFSVPGGGYFAFDDDREGVVRAIDRFLRGEVP
jgi:pimeloyl-ACP methyl ester carboxylesterase